MRKMTKPTVSTLKIRMLVPRVINSVQREVGDEFELQQPYAGMLVAQDIAEEVVEKPASSKKSAKAEDGK